MLIAGRLPTNKISGALYGGPWPGHKMEQIEGTDIYRITAPMGPTDDRVQLRVHR